MEYNNAAESSYFAALLNVGREYSRFGGALRTPPTPRHSSCSLSERTVILLSVYEKNRQGTEYTYM